jgi:glucose dehydrogenase
MKTLPAQEFLQKPATEQGYLVKPYGGTLEQDDGQWLRPAKDYASTRYSTLSQINSGDVATLKVSFTFSTGLTHGHEAAPLVVSSSAMEKGRESRPRSRYRLY